ncbi:hypothetical protein GLAREA_06245 [Glarea lozoyensis ATCC 20868]|uniref:Endosomal spry domain-containing protein n=1 Tax=Glarea lozoyensis (strain ATCC 20868 / MF5171) TaxID=1116229 RepID=S3E478_GLAL2|nr:uncharacterized protein GLAREA_06245 [Glarea lozoyensis ATCC 20868]EPE33233.1 hypothetical protein GLAREA_06245 [Glarea lozoyensis ATCC 20868]
MAPLKTYLTTLLRRAPLPTPTLIARADPQPVPGADGVTPFESIPNNAVFALFGIIGVGFVLTGIWFFFWAKNGGFVFKENDWDDYKSTVLRRKGPNGTTLSGATESTDLGGGSVVHGEKEGRSIWGGRKKKSKSGKAERYKDFDEESRGFTEITGTTESTEKSRWKLRKDKKKAAKEARLRGGDLASEMTETTEMLDDDVDHSVVDAMRAYRHEKPARVGGLNTVSEGSAWDGSMGENSTTASSDALLANRERTPTKKKKKDDSYTGGIRKVVSTSKESTGFFGRTTTTSRKHDDERIKAEAAKLQAKGRAAQRRDFSFQHGDDASTVVSEEDLAREQRREARRDERERRKSRSPTKRVPGEYAGSESVESDLGTKSYRHVIPGLSVSGGGSEVASTVGSSVAGSEGYKEERRRRRAEGGGREKGERSGGYRRGRRDSLE